MHQQTAHKELYDPFAHYARGALFFDQKTFKFVAYRMPYVELDNKTWKTEQAFRADYQRVVDKKYAMRD